MPERPAGAANTGSGAGGSGIVILRYPYYALDALGLWSDEPLRNPTFMVESMVIRTPFELAQFAWLANQGETFAGRTVTLANDIDLYPHGWRLEVTLPVSRVRSMARGTPFATSGSIRQVCTISVYSVVSAVTGWCVA